MFDRIPNTFLVITEAVVQICSVKKVLLKISQNSKENNRRQILAQLLSCEFSKIFDNTFFTEHLRWLLL